MLSPLKAPASRVLDSLAAAVLCLILGALHCVDVYAFQDSRVAPHPWLSSAPGEFVRLIDRGNVSFQVDDERLDREKKQGLTLFQLEIDFRFRYEILSKSFNDGNCTMDVQVQYAQTKLKPHHQVAFRSTFRPSNPWQTPLMQHEFDHVAISTDPRLASIVKGFFEYKKYNWKLRFEQSDAPTLEQVQQAIVGESQTLILEIEALVQREYDRLDSATANGELELNDRTEFFYNLFSADSKRVSKTEHLQEVPLKRFESWGVIAPRKLEEHYRISPAKR